MDVPGLLAASLGGWLGRLMTASRSLVTPADAHAAAADAQTIVDALLYSVSHDLRSPLLTMSLSADLVEDALRKQGVPVEEGSTAIALEALRHGAVDLERMLQALTQVSRARRRPLEPSRVALAVVLGGYEVATPGLDLRRCAVAVDPLVAREVIDVASGDGSPEVRVSIEAAHALIDLPYESSSTAPSPLEALASSLQTGAGAAVERLAVSQVIIERQGGALQFADGRLRMWLPLAEEP